MNWAGAPELGAVLLLAVAFASVVKRCHTYVSRVWLAGWCLIVIHFAAHFIRIPNHSWDDPISALGLFPFVWAAFLFMFASDPYRQNSSLYWIGATAAAAISLYLILLLFFPASYVLLCLSAVLVGAVPFTAALLTKGFHHPLRRLTVTLFASLAVFLLGYQHSPRIGSALALNAVLFALYFGCSFHLWYSYRRATTGAIITIAGFFSWSAVFVIRPTCALLWPTMRFESGVWHLPTYIVAVGMMLLLLEDQVEHNQHLALHDDLTGLPNRRLFHDRLSGAIERARRAESPAALLLIDLDNFKQINDRFGHAAGDSVLRHVSQIFAGRIRKSDTVARTGGDEFCIILEAPASRADALQVAQMLMLMLCEPLRLGDHHLPIGASIGLALYPDDARDAESLCIAADLKMYENKRHKPKRSIGAACVLSQHESLANDSIPAD